MPLTNKFTEMEIIRITSSMLMLLIMSFHILAQSENVDLSMIYKIKQEEAANSKIEELVFWMTD